MTLLVCMAAAMFVPLTARASSQAIPVAGKDYAVLAKPRLASQGPGIEVVEVFSYACHACAKFEPQLVIWLRKRPSDVRFVYVPAIFGGPFDAAAKAYYTALELGVVDKTHEGIYRAVHDDHTLTSDSLEDICKVYARLGVNPDSFRHVYLSDSVTARVRWAHSYAIAEGVRSTPTIIVDGKYRVAAGPFMPAEKMLATVDYLIKLERHRRAMR